MFDLHSVTTEINDARTRCEVIELSELLTKFFHFFLHFSELKRRLKAEQKAKEKADKDATALQNGIAAAASVPTPADGANAIDEAEITPNEFFKLRSAAVEEYKKTPATHPYPHKFHVSISLENFIEKFSHVADGERLEDVKVSVAGRIHSIRSSGPKLIFYDLRGEGVKIQVMANARSYHSEEAFAVDNARIRRGDIIGVEGVPGKTKKGELSIMPTNVSLSHARNRERDDDVLIVSLKFPVEAIVAVFAHVANAAFWFEG